LLSGTETNATAWRPFCNRNETAATDADSTPNPGTQEHTMPHSIAFNPIWLLAALLIALLDLA